jgi:hypothetical protein
MIISTKIKNDYIVSPSYFSIRRIEYCISKRRKTGAVGIIVFGYSIAFRLFNKQIL